MSTINNNQTLQDNGNYVAFLRQITSDFNTYFVILSSFVGIPCNLISMGIFWRLRRHKTNMGFLCLCQAAVDLLVLVSMFVLIRPPGTLFTFNLVIASDAACKFLTYLRRFVLHISSWMLVLTTFDRLTFVLYGHALKFKFMKSKLVLSGIIVSMFVAITIADTPNLLFFLTASSSCTGSLVVILASDMVSIVLRTYAPLILMVVFNLIMLHKIFDKSRMTSKQTTRSLNRREHQFTMAVMAFDVYFFLTNFPLSVFYIFYDINLYSGAFGRGADPLFVATYNLLSAITVNLSFTEQTLSFFTNLAFNKLFRREIVIVVSRIVPYAKIRRIGPSQTVTAIQSSVKT